MTVLDPDPSEPGEPAPAPSPTAVAAGLGARVAPTREDPLAGRLGAVLGGPAGTRVDPARHGWWTAARVLVLLAVVVLSVGVVQKQPCRTAGWTTPAQFVHACYSDLPLVFGSSGLAGGAVPYLDAVGGQYLHQPVLTGLSLWAVGKVTPGAGATDQARWYFDLSTLLIAGLVGVLVMLTVAGAGRRRPWDAALVALCPLLALSALVSLDLLGVTLAAGGLLAWARSRPLLAGVLLGSATAARSYPALLVLVLLLVAARAGRLREWGVSAAAAVVTFLAVLAPWAVLNLDGTKAVYTTWSRSTAGYGSLWMLPQTLTAAPRPRWVDKLGWNPGQLSPGAVTTLALVGVLVALGFAALLTLGEQRRPRVAQVAFVVVAIVLVTGKSWPVQASLWLLPLAALARPRWRDHLIWVACEATYFVGVWMYVAGLSRPDRGLPGPWYSLLVLIRVAGVLWLVGCVVRDIRRPERDVVRADGVDDPLGGPCADAPDARVVRFS